MPNSKKFTVFILLIAGIALLYFDFKKKNQVSNYSFEGTSVTMIDLTKKNNALDVLPYIGVALILIAVGILLFTFFKSGSTQSEVIEIPNPIDTLTNQERNIVDLIQSGKTNKEISSDLSISVSTVKTHINNIYKKMNVSSRQELKKNLEFTGV